MRHIKWTHPPNPLRANAHTRARARLGEGAKHPLRWWCNYVGLIPLSQYPLSGLLPYAASAVSAHDASNQPWFYAFPFSRLSAPCAHGPTCTAVSFLPTWSVVFFEMERIHTRHVILALPACLRCAHNAGSLGDARNLRMGSGRRPRGCAGRAPLNLWLMSWQQLR